MGFPSWRRSSRDPALPPLGGEIELGSSDNLIGGISDEASLRQRFLHEKNCSFLVALFTRVGSWDPAAGVIALLCQFQIHSRSETWRLLLLVGTGLGILVNTFQGDGAPVIASIALSFIAFAVAFSMVRWLGPVFIKAGLKGKDMAKPRKPEM